MSVINSAALDADKSLGQILPNKFCCVKKASENNMYIWPILNILGFY